MPPKSKSKFVYQQRTPESIKKRASQKSGMFDSPFMEGVDVFAPKAGDHKIRILPPTWENPEHYGIEVYFHSNLGPDQQTYLCLAKMGKGDCPVCDEVKRTKPTDKETEDYIKSLKPYKRVLTWVIDRNDDSAGPMLYNMPWTMDKSIALLSTDDDNGGIIPIDHPEEGFDVEFSKEGQGLKTKYEGIKISRRSTPISNDARVADSWLEYISEHPLPSVLVFYDYDYIQRVFEGSPATPQEEASTRVRNPEPEVEDRRAPKGRATEDDDDRQTFRDRLDRRGSGAIVTELKDEPDEVVEEVEETEEKEVEAPAETVSNRRDRIREGLNKAKR